MPCFTIMRRGQTKEQRKLEIQKATRAIDELLRQRKVTMKVGPQGAITFVGIPASVRDDMTDECVYRELQKQGSAAARLALQKAEMMAGRKIDPMAINAGIHSHDGGNTWHPRG